MCQFFKTKPLKPKDIGHFVGVQQEKVVFPEVKKLDKLIKTCHHRLEQLINTCSNSGYEHYNGELKNELTNGLMKLAEKITKIDTIFMLTWQNIM